MKQKLLKALDIALEDISEERLLDILLDSYESKKRRVEGLDVENARERQRIYEERENLRQEYNRLRSDPTALASGDFFFQTKGGYARVSISCGRVVLTENFGDFDWVCRSISPMEYSDRK